MVASPQFFSYIGIEPKSDFELARMTEEGLPLDSIVSLKDHGLTFTEISDIIISPRTLKRRKSLREPLSNEETDRVVRVARLLSMAEEIFGSRKKALASVQARRSFFKPRPYPCTQTIPPNSFFASKTAADHT